MMLGNMKFTSSVDKDSLTSKQSERVIYPVQHEKYISYFQASICFSVYYIKILLSPNKNRALGYNAISQTFYQQNRFEYNMSCNCTTNDTISDAYCKKRRTIKAKQFNL